MEIRRVGWSDYPEYGTGTPVIAAPAYPADETEGAFVIQTLLGAYDDASMTYRDIYYYAAFAYDVAGNYSVFDIGAADRSTSYWLGDVDPVDARVAGLERGRREPRDFGEHAAELGDAVGPGPLGHPEEREALREREADPDGERELPVEQRLPALPLVREVGVEIHRPGEAPLLRPDRLLAEDRLEPAV